MVYRFLATLSVIAVMDTSAFAQAVPRTVIAEHFTNTYCSVCANRNPGFFQNLAQQPGVLHMAYYTSLPYVQCPLSQYDSPPQDSRAIYYDVFGSTPRIVVQGVAVDPGVNYGDSTIFDLGDDTVSSFRLEVSLMAMGAGNGLARVVVKKSDTSAADSLGLYAAITQDTLFFAANNGEQIHHNVFRRALWGDLPVKVAMPENIGDSVVYTQPFQIDPSWPLSRISATAVLHRVTEVVEQAARSGIIDTSAVASGVRNVERNVRIRISPNPVVNELFIHNSSGATATGEVRDGSGKLLRRLSIPAGESSIRVADLPPGNYLLSIPAEGSQQGHRFTKR